MKSAADSSVQPAIEPATCPVFEPYPLTSRDLDTLRPPGPGELLLWRFRSEWQLISRDAGHQRLSQAELKRMRTHPHAAFGKRFAVGRAVLRSLLAPMTGEAPERIALIDDAGGRVRCAGNPQARALDIAVDYAGIWILIGIASCPLGIGTEAPRSIDRAIAATRAAARRAALAMAAGEPPPVDAARLEQEGPALWVDLPPTGSWHLLDIPMAGELCATVAAAARVTRITAFGWRHTHALAPTSAAPFRQASGRGF
ncbi:hypothetical protein [Burkholderia alba]|uniref:hypothetical protein n=1 Tax=Burkholderia alba TaxID=2683677 RepID=UPI002B05A172|nr:hypothetical protein [Burkholderia alba]